MGDIISASIAEIAQLEKTFRISAAKARLTAGSGSATGASQREIARNVVNRLPEYLLETHHGH
jgi:hypothetical protein